MRRGLALALALLTMAACGDGGGFVDAAIPDAPPPPGTFSLTWTLADSAGSAVTCDQAGATSVIVVAHDDVGINSFNETFFCATGDGTSGVITPSTYDFSFILEDPSGANLGTAPKEGSIVVNPGKNTVLPTLKFVAPAAP